MEHEEFADIAPFDDFIADAAAFMRKVPDVEFLA
jgi:hypothetical protein